ncbi:MAG: MarR family transcriptional regulator [Clostridiales bacterium]|nr:MarR family transcriptional regulator [Clostridiales bacterium]
MARDMLMQLFDEILRRQDKVIITDEFKDISNNDMHIIAAIGLDEPRSMSAVARDLSVTVGTLTIAINNLVKKSYVRRVRSEKDRRVVLVSLLDKGIRAYKHHRQFHDEMIQATLQGLDEEQTQTLIRALENLNAFFRDYGKH